jgi:hypothetical protein
MKSNTQWLNTTSPSVVPSRASWPGATAANITSHPDKGLGKWSDTEIKRAITQGISRDGRKLQPPMDFASYRGMTDADLNAIVAYLRNEPVDPEEVRSSPTALDERRALQARLQKDRGEAQRANAEERPQRVEEALEAVRSAGEGASSWTTDDGEPLLAVAAGHGLREVVEALLAVGADPGAAAAHSQVTPLIRAAESGHREVASLLLARGADPNAVDAEGRSALVAAAEYGDPELVQLLLKAGADPKRRGADGRGPADRARGPFTREIHELVPKEEPPAPSRKKAARRKGPESPEGRP